MCIIFFKYFGKIIFFLDLNSKVYKVLIDNKPTNSKALLRTI